MSLLHSERGGVGRVALGGGGGEQEARRSFLQLHFLVETLAQSTRRSLRTVLEIFLLRNCTAHARGTSRLQKIHIRSLSCRVPILFLCCGKLVSGSHYFMNVSSYVLCTYAFRSSSFVNIFLLPSIQPQMPDCHTDTYLYFQFQSLCCICTSRTYFLFHSATNRLHTRLA